jgi:hypothetical protein
MRLVDLTHNNKKRGWNMSGKLRKTSRLHYLLKKGYIPNTGDILTLCYQLDTMITKLNQVYKDNWDMYLVGNKLQIVIRFKRIVISNTNGSTHNIRELFVKLELKLENNVTIRSYTGTRAQRDLTEENNSYSHSHLGRYVQLGEFEDFCYTSTEVYDLRAMFNSKFDENIFDLLLQTIDTYVRHESLEGVPHMYIEKLRYEAAGRNSNLESLSKDLLELYSIGYFKIIGSEENPIKYHILENNFIEIDEKYLREELRRHFIENSLEGIAIENLKEILVEHSWRKSFNSGSNLLSIRLAKHLNGILTEKKIGENSIRFSSNNILEKRCEDFFLFRGEEILIKKYTTKEHRNYAKEQQNKEEWEQKGQVRNEIFCFIKHKLEIKLNAKRKTQGSGF